MIDDRASAGHRIVLMTNSCLKVGDEPPWEAQVSGIGNPLSAGLDDEARRGLRRTRGEVLFDEHEAICAGECARRSSARIKEPTEWRNLEETFNRFGAAVSSFHRVEDVHRVPVG